MSSPGMTIIRSFVSLNRSRRPITSLRPLPFRLARVPRSTNPWSSARVAYDFQPYSS